MEITIEGLDELTEKLARLKNVPVSLVWEGIGQDVTQEVRPYPAGPSQEAGKTWYQRGYGSRYVRKSGGLSSGSRTSEQLGQQWRQQVAENSVTIENLASYAPFVHGAEQVGFHGRQGWRKLKETAEELLPRIVAGIEEQIRRIIESR